MYLKARVTDHRERERERERERPSNVRWSRVFFFHSSKIRGRNSRRDLWKLSLERPLSLSLSLLVERVAKTHARHAVESRRRALRRLLLPAGARELLRRRRRGRAHGRRARPRRVAVQEKRERKKEKCTEKERKRTQAGHLGPVDDSALVVELPVQLGVACDGGEDSLAASMHFLRSRAGPRASAAFENSILKKWARAVSGFGRSTARSICTVRGISHHPQTSESDWKRPRYAHCAGDSDLARFVVVRPAAHRADRLVARGVKERRDSRAGNKCDHVSPSPLFLLSRANVFRALGASPNSSSFKKVVAPPQARRPDAHDVRALWARGQRLQLTIPLRIPLAFESGRDECTGFGRRGVF